MTGCYACFTAPFAYHFDNFTFSRSQDTLHSTRTYSLRRRQCSPEGSRSPHRVRRREPAARRRHGSVSSSIRTSTFTRPAPISSAFRSTSRPTRGTITQEDSSVRRPRVSFAPVTKHPALSSITTTHSVTAGSANNRIESAST